MRNKWIYTIVVLALGLFASCSDNMDEPGADEKSRKVVFRLALDEAVGSRAAWNESYDAEDGNAFEKTIKGDSLRVAIFGTDNVMLGEVQDLLHWPVSTGTGEEYQFVGDISGIDLTAGEEYKIMVLANTTSASGSTTWSDMQYDFNQLSIPTGSIPMWGVKQVSLTLAEIQDIGVIDVLRAAAKVEVCFSEALKTEGYTFENVYINKIRDKGYFFPTNWNNVTETKEIDRSGGFRSSLGQLLGNTLFEIDGTTGNAFLYLPEFDNVTFGPVLISVALNDDEGNSRLFENAISFTDYDENTGLPIAGTTTNIIRNHYYRFVITEVKGEGLELIYLVADWEDGGEFTHTFDYPSYLNPVMDDAYIDSSLTEEQRASYAIVTEPTMVFDSDNALGTGTIPFSCWFKFDGPNGKVAIPTIAEGPANYVIEVYKNGAIIASGECVADPNNWYNIKIRPTASLGTENQAIIKFGITYHQDWMPTGGHIHLYINGDAAKTAWPNSGNDPKHIEIKQIKITNP